jgi:thioredoxin-related protein
LPHEEGDDKSGGVLPDVADAGLVPSRLEFRTKGYVIMSILKGLGVLGSIILCVIFYSSQATAKDQNAARPRINWLDFEKAEDLSRAQPRKIFVDVYTTWCSWCKVMDKKTFTDPLIIDYVNKKYYAVKFDGEEKESITFRGKVYESKGGFHALAALLLQEKMIYPTYVILDEDFNILEPIRGFKKAAELDVILKYYAENHYTKTDYEAFAKTYKSPYGDYQKGSFELQLPRLIGH